MKVMLVLLAILSVAAIFSFGKRVPVAGAVGTRPGDIGSSSDIVASARQRGNDLASFAAG